MIKYINFLILVGTLCFSQIQYGGAPKYNPENINYINTNNLEIIERDLHPMVLKYADEYSVDVNFLDVASKMIGNYETTFYLGVESADAKALAFVFDQFKLTNNTEMFIYSEDRSMYIGSFNSKNNPPSGDLATAVVKGDKVIIELTVPNKEIKDLDLHLGVITHDFLDIMKFHEDEYYNDRVDCNDNVACPSADPWEDQVDAVVLVSSNGGVCSGAIVNNTEQDLTPYLLYAAHCNGGGSSTVYFNYQSNTCNGNNPGQYNSMSGTQNLAIGNFNNNDYALIRLNNNIPNSYSPYYAGWNRTSSNPGNDVVGIHHADGDIKKISYDAYGMQSSGNAWVFAYSSGRVIPGSSGSPFFDNSKRIRGMASYIIGDYCSPAPDCYCAINYYHGYAKLSSAWNYIDQYLDPNNSGVVFMDGTRNGYVYGCTDPLAENYDPNADIDDGTCEYSYGNANFSFGNISGDNIEIFMDNDVAVGGFQFTLADSPNSITLTEASGGSASANGFEVSTSELGIVLGFSFTGGSIPAGDSLLTNIGYNFNGNNGEQVTICFEDVIASDSTANPLEVNNGSCQTVDFNGSASFTFGNVTSNSMEVYLSSSADISGFQFTLDDSSDLITLTGANGGSAEANGFEVSTSELGILIGFSLTGSTIPSGDGLLTILEFDTSGSGSTEVCIGQTIVSDTVGNELLSTGDCINLEISDGILGDINDDSSVNIQDVVILINFILGDDSPEGSEFYAADLNGDGTLNIQDVVILINIILA